MASRIIPYRAFGLTRGFTTSPFSHSGVHHFPIHKLPFHPVSMGPFASWVFRDGGRGMTARRLPSCLAGWVFTLPVALRMQPPSNGPLATSAQPRWSQGVYRFGCGRMGTLPRSADHLPKGGPPKHTNWGGRQEVYLSSNVDGGYMSKCT